MQEIKLIFAPSLMLYLTWVTRRTYTFPSDLRSVTNTLDDNAHNLSLLSENGDVLTRGKSLRLITVVVIRFWDQFRDTLSKLTILSIVDFQLESPIFPIFNRIIKNKHCHIFTKVFSFIFTKDPKTIIGLSNTNIFLNKINLNVHYIFQRLGWQKS